MLIHGQEYGNTYGCVYSIKNANVEIVVHMIWEDDGFSYNEQEIKETLNESKISTEMKLAIHQYIEKTNYLFYLSYKEKQ